MEILTGIISKIMEYAVESVWRKVSYLIDYKNNLENLRSHLNNLDAAKDRMNHAINEVERSGKILHNDVRNWRTAADEITREAENILGDECQAKTKCFHGVCPNLVSYHQLSRKAAKLAKMIELKAKVEFTSISYNARLEEIFDTPVEDYMAFESRISMVNKIMAELRNPGTNLVGVYGIGGVGKSTLVQEVYRQTKKEKLFDDVVLVLDVKRFPEAEKEEKIQKKIAEKLDMDVQESQDMEARAKHLWNRIKDIKSLIIVDDVWEAINLEAMGLRPMATCKILLTSRDLVPEMRIQKVFRLDVLDEKESWSLFEKVASAVVKDDPIKKVATQVSKKCGGLPVLIITVASALRSCTALEVWKDALRRFKSFDKKGLTEKAYLAIEWSYNRLDGDELKPLFLLCGIIAGSRCTIYLNDLLKYAMGLSLVKNVDTVEEARNTLFSLAKKLKDCCLLQDIDDDGDFRMHHYVRDVAIEIAFKDKHVIAKTYGDELKEWPDKDFLDKCSAISLISCKIPRLPEVPWVCPELRFFVLVNDNIDDSLEIPGNYFEGMKELKVLDVTKLRIPLLPPSLQSLTNLQTLCLHQCKLRDIALVGHLTNLKVLSLMKSQVNELPKEIGQLTRLQLLDLSHCYELVRISPGVISSLTSLEDLRMGINSFKQWEGEGSLDRRRNASVSELKQLHQLIALDIHIPDAKLLPANMFSDTRLERYTILIGDCWLYPDIYETSSNMLKLKLTTNGQFDRGIQLLLERCEHLYLDGMEAANIISYILESDSGKQLKNLHVQNNDAVTAVVNSSHAFPILESLSLYNLVNLETVCCGQLIAQPFQKLRSFGLSSKGSTSVVSTEAEEIILENEIGGPMKLFMNGEVLMPNLTRLILDQCDGLRFLFSSSMARSLEQLEHIEISKCQMMEELVSTSGYNQEHTNNMFCNLKYLKLQYLPSLTTFCSRSYIEFSLLEILHIEDCPRLGTFIFDGKNEITTMGKENDDRNPEENLETVIPHFLFDEKVGFPSLERLIIHDLPKLMTIWHNRLAPNSFRNLREVTVLRCDALISIFVPSMMRRLNALGTLKIEQCKSLQVVFEQTYDTSTTELKTFECPNLDYVEINSCENLKNIFDPMSTNITINKATEEIRDSMENIGTDAQYFLFDEEVGFPSLESLIIRDLPALSTICYNRLAPNSFCKLKKVEVLRCNSLINIFTPSMMGRLNALYMLRIKQCESLQLVFEEGVVLDVKEAYGTSRNQLKIFECPNLEYVEINSCESLKNIFPASVAKGLQQLRKLYVENCEILEEIVAKDEPETTPEFVFSKVTHAQFQYLPQLRSFYPGLYVSKWPLLKQLFFFECGIVELFASEYSGFQERLDSGLVCTTIKQAFLVVDKGNSFPNLDKLEILKVYECGRLKNLTSSAISFQNLTTLDVWRCGELKYLTTYSVAKCLHQLKRLEVVDCKSMIEIVASNGDEQDSGNYYKIAFSCLQHLKLSDLPILRGFCSSGNSTVKVPSLNSLIVEECLIELKISPDGSLIQSGSRPERLQITEEVEEEEE